MEQYIGEKAVALLKEYDIQMWTLEKIDEKYWVLKTDKHTSGSFRVLFTNLFPERNIGFGLIEPLRPGIDYLKPDVVNHPSHYNSGSIEVIEAIEDWKLTYHKGNAVKYIARAGKKDPTKEVEDLEKAVWYLKRDIEKLKSKLEGREALRPNAMNKA